ncbi:TRAP transporter small permease [Kerstersia similis]|uniref:TRAP transporter small permease n=1 Tax=Kerstersia similis TaxID=206505 RepID=UPI0039F068FF
MHTPAIERQERPRSPLAHAYQRLMSACGAVGALTFGLMALLIGCDVILRNLGLNWLPSSVEISEYMLMLATFVAAPWLLYQGGHIRIDVLITKMPRLTAQLCEVLCNLTGVIVCAVLAWQSLLVAMDAATQGSLVFKEIVFPEWWLNMPLLFGASLLCIEFLRRLYLSLQALRQQGN